MNPEKCRKECEFAEGIHAQDGFFFIGCHHEPYRGKWVREIKECPKEVKRQQNPSDDGLLGTGRNAPFGASREPVGSRGKMPPCSYMYFEILRQEDTKPC